MTGLLLGLLLMTAQVHVSMQLVDRNIYKVAGCGIDVALLLDCSTQMGQVHFEEAKDFFSMIAARVVIPDTRFAMVTYDDTQTTLFNLGDYTEEHEVHLAIDSAQYCGSANADLGDALDFVLSDTFTNGNVNNNPDFLIAFISQTTDNLIAVENADVIKAQNISIIALGIGDNVDTALLNAIASEPKEDFAFHPADNETLIHIVSEVLDTACGRCEKHGPGWVHREGSQSCYKFFKKERKCRKAQRICSEASAYIQQYEIDYVTDFPHPMLVRIEDEPENDWLMRWIVELNARGNILIGAFVDWSAPNATEGYQHWDDCLTDYIHWTNWAPGEPNNHREGNEACTHMIGQKFPQFGKWNDIPRRKTNSFICEIPRFYIKRCEGPAEAPNPGAHKRHYTVTDVCRLKVNDDCIWNSTYELGPPNPPNHMVCEAPCNERFRIYVK